MYAFTAKQLKIESGKLSNEYIRGLVEGEGSFTFSTNSIAGKPGKRRKVPAFAIGMHIRDKNLILKLRNSLGLKNKIYEYHRPQGKDGIKRGPQAMLIVREFGPLKNIIVPFFYKKLHGYKGKQFDEWIEKIGSDPEVSELFKLIYRMFKSGFYDRNNKFLNEAN